MQLKNCNSGTQVLFSLWIYMSFLCGFQYESGENEWLLSLSSLSFLLSTHTNLFSCVYMWRAERESMLCGSTLLEVDIGEHKWVSWESESGRGRKAVKSVLISCLLNRQLGHNSTGDSVEYTSGMLRDYIHFLTSTHLKKKKIPWTPFWLLITFFSVFFPLNSFCFLSFHII